MIKIIAVGKVRKKELNTLINDYIKMIPRKVELIEVKDEATIDKMHLEADKIMKNIKTDDYVITLEILGKKLDSEKLSDLIDGIETNYSNDIVFIIGGSFGLDKSVSDRSNYKLSFSDMTFPHQLMKLMLVEQVFRAYAILSNHPYHK